MVTARGQTVRTIAPERVTGTGYVLSGHTTPSSLKILSNIDQNLQCHFSVVISHYDVIVSDSSLNRHTD